MVSGNDFVSEAGKGPKLRCINNQREPEMATICQLGFCPWNPGHAGALCWLPGHGNATARNCSRSTRASVLAVSRRLWRRRSAISLIDAPERCRRVAIVHRSTCVLQNRSLRPQRTKARFIELRMAATPSGLSNGARCRTNSLRSVVSACPCRRYCATASPADPGSGSY
jgi:hypothetical protein